MTRRERQRRRRQNRGSTFRRVTLFGSMLFGCAVLIGVLAAVGWVASVANSAPDITQLRPRDPGQTTSVFAADGTLLGYIGSDVLRTEVAPAQLPQILREATVAIEDKRFYHHGGVDYYGMLRAGVRDVFGGHHGIQGGSTLTMQLVDNVYLPEQYAIHHNLRYKIVQAKLAEQLESHRSKDWILDQYLNDVPYGTIGGQTAVGVGAAAQVFFDRPVGKLNLAQAALLAGLPQAPSEYNPFLAPQTALARRNQVLQAMLASHYITADQAAAAEAAPLEVKRNSTYETKRDPFVFDYVKQALIDRFGLATVERGGLKVYATIDLRRQAEARAALLSNEGYPNDPAAALVSIDPNTGHILAMATTASYDKTNFDYATQSHRQTGSAFKVFVLMTLIHDFHGDPNQTYYNSHELLPGWLPQAPTFHVQTAEHSYLGEVNVTKATTLSDNSVFAQLDADVGPDRVRDTAYAMGITSHLDGYYAEGIGGLRIGVSPLEMADAYATLANGGVHIPPTVINDVVFPDGSRVVLGNPPHKRVFTDGEAYAATQVLKTVIQSGTGTAADYGCPAAGKTGTTSNYTDAWFVGYTPQLSTAVWVGYPNSTESMNDINGLGPAYGGTLAAPIWHDYMAKASNGFCGDFPTPTVPFVGTQFLGHYATTGGYPSRYGSGGYYNGSGGYSNGAGTSTSGSGGTSANPYNNPSLYAAPPQPAPAPSAPPPPSAPAPPSGNSGGGTSSGNSGSGGTSAGSTGAGAHH